MDKGISWSRYLREYEPEDRAILVAVLMDKAEHCNMCGLTEREWLDDPGAYVAMQVVCPWCAVKDRARADSDTDASIPGAAIKMVSAGTAEHMMTAKAERPASKRERSLRQ